MSDLHPFRFGSDDNWFMTPAPKILYLLRSQNAPFFGVVYVDKFEALRAKKEGDVVIELRLADNQ